MVEVLWVVYSYSQNIIMKRSIKQMLKVFDLTPEKKMWLKTQLEGINLPEEYIYYVMNTAWYEVCTDIDELETIVKNRWNLEFENLEKLYDYLYDSKYITVFPDDDSCCYTFLVSVDTIYKSGSAEISTSDQFDSLKDFYNHLGASYRKSVSYETFIKHWCVDYKDSWHALINDNGQKICIDYGFYDGTVIITHVGDVNCGSDKEIADLIELHNKV